MEWLRNPRLNRGMRCACRDHVNSGADPRNDTAISSDPTCTEKRMEVTMAEMQTTAGKPAWWNDKHSSDWDRVKAAFQRDWEQTKADFTNDNAHKLNQNVADTVLQSVGEAPIPPPGVMTRPNDPTPAANAMEKARQKVETESVKTANAVTQANQDMAMGDRKLVQKVADVQKDLTTQQGMASEKIADAQAKAIAVVANGQASIAKAGAERDKAIATWHEAEQKVRYGYAVRSQYAANYIWDNKLEGKLRGEWDALHTGMTWNDSRVEIQRGWNYNGKTI